MKSNVKKRQEIAEKVSDIQATMIYFLEMLHRKYGFGAKRLPELYDAVLLEMYRDVRRTNAGLTGGVGDYYTRFSMDYKLTFDDYLERQEDAIKKVDKELQEEIEKYRQERWAWIMKERAKNNE